MLALCTVQEGQVPPATRDRLAAELTALVGAAFGGLDDPLPVHWVEVAEGSGFSARQPSTSSIVGVLVPDGTDRSVREPLMHGIVDSWTRVTGCTAHEVVVSVVDEGALAPRA